MRCPWPASAKTSGSTAMRRDLYAEAVSAADDGGFAGYELLFAQADCERVLGNVERAGEIFAGSRTRHERELMTKARRPMSGRSPNFERCVSTRGLSPATSTGARETCYGFPSDAPWV